MNQASQQPVLEAGPEYPAKIWSVLVRSLAFIAPAGSPPGTPGTPTESEDLWQMGQVVPGSDANPLVIVAMYLSDDDGIDVFVLPSSGSEMHKNAQALIINLSSKVIRQTVTVVGGEVWHRMMKDVREIATDQFTAALASKWTGIPADRILEHLTEIREEIKEEEEDDEDEEEPEIGTTAAAPAPPNGAT
jgi:hypothetical protein